MLKRTFDLTLSLLGLVVLSPFLLLIAIAVKVDSAGGVFFRQERMGRGGGSFRIYKFRTMVRGAEKRGCAITVNNDERITRVGHVLRRLKLDEFPQLINVVRGEMSLVGPRPEIPKYRGHYSQEFSAIFDVRPGITDPASLKFRHESALLDSRKDPETYYLHEILPQKLKLNLAYVADCSLLLDLKIVLLTIGVTFLPRFFSRTT